MIYTCVYGSHEVSQNSHKCNTCPHLPAFSLSGTSSSFSFCLWTKNTKYLYHQYPHGSSNLMCTIKLNLNFFCALILIRIGLKLAKYILPHFLSISLWLYLPGYMLDTDPLMLIGYHITRDCPSLDPFKFIGQLKHMTICNQEWANYHTRTLRDHDALVMSKPQVIFKFWLICGYTYTITSWISRI